MVKVRVMPTLLFKSLGLVKGVGFDSWRRIGTVMQAVKVYNLREVDELVFLDIAATQEGRDPDFDTIDEIADECFMPLSVGGGVRTVEHVRRLLRVGADKVVFNTAAVEDASLISDVADRFGSQCVVVSIDTRTRPGGEYEVVTCSGSKRTGLNPVAWAYEVERRGAGEILLTSVERDGSMQGYDLPLVRAVADAVSIPVIASGGAGCYDHMAEAILQGGASAVSASSIFHFTEQTPMEAKVHLRSRGIDVRI